MYTKSSHTPFVRRELLRTSSSSACLHPQPRALVLSQDISSILKEYEMMIDEKDESSGRDRSGKSGKSGNLYDACD